MEHGRITPTEFVCPATDHSLLKEKEGQGKRWVGVKR